MDTKSENNQKATSVITPKGLETMSTLAVKTQDLSFILPLSNRNIKAKSGYWCYCKSTRQGARAQLRGFPKKQTKLQSTPTHVHRFTLMFNDLFLNIWPANITRLLRKVSSQKYSQQTEQTGEKKKNLEKPNTI